MKFVDYYKILEVPRGASTEEITKAYKRAARKWHPDLNKASEAEQRFKEVNEAHEVLKDPKTRERYDMLGANWKHGSNFRPPAGFGQNVQFDFGGGGGAGGGFSDFFEQVFGASRAGAGRRRSARPGMGGMNIEDILGGGLNFEGNGQPPSRGHDAETNLSIDLEDSYRGNKRKVEISSVQGVRKYEVTIPRGIREGEKIRLSGQGHRGSHGQRGDLFLKIRITPHPVFSVEGDDLVVTVPVMAWDAALGAAGVAVPTMDSEVKMTLPRGLRSGQRLRIKGKGLPLRGGGRGDLYAELRVDVPGELSGEQQELFEQLRALKQGEDADDGE